MAETYESLVDLYDKSCQRYANRELFGVKREGEWRYLSYRQFDELVQAARAGLAARGVGPGDRVAIVANNRLEWAVLAYATYCRGAVFVPMYESQPAEEWKFILGDCEAKLAVAATPKIYECLSSLRSELPTLQHVVGLDLPEAHSDSYAALLATGKSNPSPPVAPQAQDVAGLIYTSGTTGTPKGVILTHANFCSNVTAIQEVFQLDAERSLAFLPWAHSLGQTGELHMLFSSGCSIAINDDLQRLLGNLIEVKPTVLIAVPRIFNRIYDGVHKQIEAKPKPLQLLFHSAIESAKAKSRGESLGPLRALGLALANKLIFAKIRQKFGGRLRLVISGSAALSPEIAEFIDALGIMVFEGYGLTETSPVVAVNYPGHRKIGSVGKALPGVRVKIDASVGTDADSSKEPVGEIVIYGPNVMRGYHRRPEESREVLLPDGGFRSGDLGYLDKDGYLYITGRLKEQYKLENGKYVAPAPLEEQLKLSHYISNAMIYGENKPYNAVLLVPDPQALGAWAKEHGVELGDVSRNPRVKELLEKEVAARAAEFKSYARPRRVAVIDQDFTVENGMLTPSLKLKRRNIVAHYADLLASLYA